MAHSYWNKSHQETMGKSFGFSKNKWMKNNANENITLCIEHNKSV